MNNPLIGLFKTLLLFTSNRIKYDRNAINHEICMPDGKSFKIFRRVNIISKNAPDPEAYFIVRFKPKNMGVNANIRFSVLPMMIFMGFKGFRSKYWAVHHASGLCQGLYEWQTVEDAENYSRSIAMRFMTKRSEPGSVEFKIIDKTVESLEYRVG